MISTCRREGINHADGVSIKKFLFHNCSEIRPQLLPGPCSHESDCYLHTDIGVLLRVPALGTGCYRQAVPVLISTKGQGEMNGQKREKSDSEQGLRRKQIQTEYKEKVLH